MSATPTTTAPATRRGFLPLPCPRCGEEHVCSLDLADLDTVTCRGCDAELSLSSDVAPMVVAWVQVLTWVDQAPELPADE